ncbi:MAG: hypothetical protein WAX69_03930 [Victivallales bacterium]
MYEHDLLHLTEHLGHDWISHLVSFSHPVAREMPAGTAIAIRDLTYDNTLFGQIGSDGKVYFMTDLLADENRTFQISVDVDIPESDVLVKEEPDVSILASSKIAIAVPRVDSSQRAGLNIPAPLLWIQGPERKRRGCGRWNSKTHVDYVKSWVSARGPVFAEAVIEYGFQNGKHYRISWRIYSQSPVAIASVEKDVQDDGAWNFSLYDGFEPDSAHLGFGDSNAWKPDYNRCEHICRHIFFNHYSLYQDFKDNSFLFNSKGNRDADAIGLFPVNGDGWTNIGNNFISLDTTTEPDIRYSFSLTPGFCSFALFAIRQQDTRIRRRSDFTYGKAIVGNAGTGVFALSAKWSMVRLDDVKEMVLDWERHPQSYPFLHSTPERFAEVVGKLKSTSGRRFEEMTKLHPLFSGHKGSLESLRKAFFWHLEQLRDNAIELGANGCNISPVMCRPLVECPYFYETLLAHHALSPEEDRRACAIMAFMAYFTSREDYYFGRYALLPEGHPNHIMHLYKGMRSENFGTDRFVAIGIAGAIFPDHPMAPAWRQMASELFRLQMDELVAESGAWCEGWNYYHWSLHLLMNYALVMRNVGEDLFANAKFKKMIRFVMDTLSPLNPLYDGHRMNPGFGSYGEYYHGAAYKGCAFGYLMAQAAWAYRENDPQFSRELMWAYREIDHDPFEPYHRTDHSYHEAMVALNTDFDLTPKRPERNSHGCPGFGAVFHHLHEDNRETYLIARASPYWPHGHPDAGSFFMYYKNAPLITEAARGTMEGYPFLKTLACGHNIIRFDDKDPMQYVWPNRQNLLGFVSEPDLEYAVLDCRQEKLIVSDKNQRGHGGAVTVDVAIRHFRHIIYLKPDIFIIYDSILDAPYVSDYRLHCLAKSVQFKANHALFIGLHGIDLDLHVVLPEHPEFTTAEVIDTCSVEFGNGPNMPYLVVLSPREGSAPSINCKYSNGLLEISSPAECHRLKFHPTDNEGVFDFTVENI